MKATERKAIKNEIGFVQFEPAAFFADPAFIRMSARQKGIYLTLWLSCLVQGGSISLADAMDPILSNYQGSKYKNDILLVLTRFQVRRGKVTHRHASRSLQKAFAAKLAGKKAADARWKRQSERNTNGMRPHYKGNESEVNQIKFNNFEFESVQKHNLIFVEFLEKKLAPTNQSHTTYFHRLHKWTLQKIAHGDLNDDVWDQIVELSNTAKSKGADPRRYFTTLIKNELHYHGKTSFENL